ncbi:P-loop NTPase fold protein [Pedobacter sp. Leaf170]|uniref:KAP family P-loop NTPase fold protein n=1 Tax=Pedobacter sp. Leaf170 TaxID=2876558 RepID=UPI001E4D0DB4|nr:P-loop NTPase fold protein [Pedobacter sp. Leaf170]
MTKILIDKEANLNSEDFLNTKQYAESLENLISSAPKDIPLTIGLFGEWGSGKSSIINTVKTNLENLQDIKTKFIVYDAWKYANDSFRRMFLRKVQQELGLEMNDSMASFYINKNEEVEIKKKFNIPFLMIIVVALLVAIIVATNLSLSSTAGLTLTILVSILGFIATVSSKAFNEYKVNVQKPQLFAPEQFEECFKEMLTNSFRKKTLLEKADNFIKGTSSNQFDRIVIVIDNIDRCHKNIAYDLLTNTKNFIENGFNIIFLIPVDEVALKKHIFKNDGSNPKESEEFLRKYFNATIRIKPFKNSEIYDYAKKLNDNNEIGFKPDTLNIIAKEYASNPRRILQFFNNLQLELSLLGAKHGQEFALENQKSICKFLILREEWPEYYNLVCSKPNVFFSSEQGMSKEDLKSDLASFLRETFVITMDLNYQTLEKIIINSDNYDSLPDVLLKFVDDENLDSFLLELNELSITQETVLDTFIFKLRDAIKRGFIETDVPNYINRIMYLLSNLEAVDISILNSFQTELTQKGLSLPLVLKKLPSFLNLVSFNNVLIKINNEYLDSIIVTMLKDGKAEDGTLDASGQSLFKNYIDNIDLKHASNVKELFVGYYKSQGTIYLNDLDLRQDVLPIIIDKQFISEQLISEETIYSNDQNIEDFQYLADNLENQSLVWESIIDKTTEDFEPVSNQITENKLKTINILNKILTVSDNIELSDEYRTKLGSLCEKLLSDRVEKSTAYPYNNLTIDFFSESSADDRRKIIKFLFEAYRISLGVNSIAKLLLGIYSKDEELLEVAFKDFIIENSNFSFFPLKPIVLLFQEFNENRLFITENCLLKESDKENVYSDIEVKEFLLRIYNQYHLENNIGVVFKTYMKNKRSSRLLKEVLSQLELSALIALPQDLMMLVIEQLQKQENLVEKKNDTEFLSFLIEKGNQGKLLPILKMNTLDQNLVNQSLELSLKINNVELGKLEEFYTHLKQKDVEDIADKKLLKSVQKNIQAQINKAKN